MFHLLYVAFYIYNRSCVQFLQAKWAGEWKTFKKRCALRYPRSTLIVTDRLWMTIEACVKKQSVKDSSSPRVIRVLEAICRSEETMNEEEKRCSISFQWTVRGNSLIIDRLATRRTRSRRRPRDDHSLGLEPILTFPAASCRPRKLRASYPSQRDGRQPYIGPRPAEYRDRKCWTACRAPHHTPNSDYKFPRYLITRLEIPETWIFHSGLKKPVILVPKFKRSVIFDRPFEKSLILCTKFEISVIFNRPFKKFLILHLKSSKKFDRSAKNF